jgi:hypothetical protein
MSLLILKYYSKYILNILGLFLRKLEITTPGFLLPLITLTSTSIPI